MHEVSIAQNILEVVEKEVKKNGASTAKKVRLLIGEFTNVVKEALEFALDIIKKNTSSQNAEFVIEIIKLKTYCQECDKTFIGNVEAQFICSKCRGVLKIIEGKELRVDYIDVE